MAVILRFSNSGSGVTSPLVLRFGGEAAESGIFDPNIFDPNIFNTRTAAANVDQIFSSSGTAAAVITTFSSNTFIDEQPVDQVELSGGILNTVQIYANSNTATNNQVLSSSGLISAIATFTSSNDSVNGDVLSSSGIVTTNQTSQSSNTVVAEQVQSSSGATTTVLTTASSNAFINNVALEEIYSSSGIVDTVSTSVNGNQAANEQVLISSGLTPAVTTAISSNESVNVVAVVQVFESGGISTAFLTTVSTNQATVEQVLNSSGVADAVTLSESSNASYNLTGPWGVPTTLFSEALPIQQISLTFDQLGRPLVFYRVGENTLKLYWYDPVLAQNVTAVIAEGIDPTAGFDFPQDSGQGFTDALLFYVRNDTIYMRVQRDRFAVEYPTGISKPKMRIQDCGLRVDNRFQVKYRYPKQKNA